MGQNLNGHDLPPIPRRLTLAAVMAAALVIAFLVMTQVHG